MTREPTIRIRHFNPRPPWGGRHPLHDIELQRAYIFQSTPSVGRATSLISQYVDLGNISIHALRGEGDDYIVFKVSKHRWISIHALRGEGDKPFLRIMCTI